MRREVAQENLQPSTVLLIDQIPFQNQLCLLVTNWLQASLCCSNTAGLQPGLSFYHLWRVPQITAAVHSKDESVVASSGVKWWEMQIMSLGESQQCLAQGASAEDPWLALAHCFVLVRSGNQHKR